MNETTSIDVADPRALLADAAQCQVDQDHAHTRLLITATRWADAHPLAHGDDNPAVFGDTDLRLTGDGVPTVANAAVAELAAALRMPTAAGEYLVAAAMELRHRLPRLWAGLLDGRVRPRRARDIAERTLLLSPAAADHVDRHLCHLTDRLSVRQIDRTVTDAILRHMPDRAAEQAERRTDPRGAYFDHHAGDENTAPHTYLSATLGLLDGLQLEEAVTDGARQLKQLGVEGHHQALRSLALGDLARRQPVLDQDGPGLDISDHDTNHPGPTARTATRPGKPVTLFVHFHADALAAGRGVGRIENLNTPIDLDELRRWLGDPAVQITIKPVIDLNQPIVVDAYEIPDRIRQHVVLRELCCVYPWCDKPSTAPGVDLDHIVPYAAGGPTSTENLAPLCRRHHRLKTFTRWRYRRDPDGTYVWTTPYGIVYRRQRDGTVSDTDLPPPTPPDQRDPARTMIRPPRRRKHARIPEPTGPPVNDDTPAPF